MSDVHTVNDAQWEGTVNTRNLSMVINTWNMVDTESEHNFRFKHNYFGNVNGGKIVFDFVYKHSIEKKVSGSWTTMHTDSTQRPIPAGDPFEVAGGVWYTHDNLAADHPNKDWDKLLQADVSVEEGDRLKLYCYTRIVPRSIPQFDFEQSYLQFTATKYFKVVNQQIVADVPN